MGNKIVAIGQKLALYGIIITTGWTLSARTAQAQTDNTEQEQKSSLQINYGKDIKPVLLDVDEVSATEKRAREIFDEIEDKDYTDAEKLKIYQNYIEFQRKFVDNRQQNPPEIDSTDTQLTTYLKNRTYNSQMQTHYNALQVAEKRAVELAEKIKQQASQNIPQKPAKPDGFTP